MVIERLFIYQGKPYRITRALILAIAIFAGLTQLYISFTNFSPEMVVVRDLSQDYLMGKAVREDLDPYQRISQLSARYLGAYSPYVNPHPSPHAPIVAVVFSMFANYSLLSFSVCWGVLSTVSLLTAIYLICRHEFARPPHLKYAAFFMALSLSSLAYKLEMQMGQFTIIFMLALTAAYYSFKMNHKICCGLLLGLCLSIKYFAWPFMLYFLCRREWKVALSACAFFVVSAALPWFFINPAFLIKYYKEVLPAVDLIWSNDIRNISLHACFMKLLVPPIYFVTAHPGGAFPLHVLPANDLFWQKALASLMTLLMVGIVVFRSLRAKDDRAFFALTTISVIANPTAWTFYTLFLVLPLIWFFSQVEKQQAVRAQYLFALAAIITLTFFDFGNLAELYAADPANLGLVVNPSLIDLLYSNVPALLITLIAFLI